MPRAKRIGDLTDREHEVLALIRLGLTNEQIAERLDISLAGAKYHVSEILTKLGVASREEASAWQAPEARPAWRRRALGLSLAIKIAGAVVVVGALCAVALLGWAVARSGTGSSASSRFTPLSLPNPVTPPTLTREQALVKAATVITDVLGSPIQAIEADSTTWRGATAHYSGTIPAILFGPPEPTFWLIRARVIAGQTILSYPENQTPTPTLVGCREGTAIVSDAVTKSGFDELFTDGPPLPDAECDLPFTSDLAIVQAAMALKSDLSTGVPDRISARQTSLSDAIDAMTSAGIAASLSPTSDRVWLVTMSGHFAPTTATPTTSLTPTPSPVRGAAPPLTGTPTPAPYTPGPTPQPVCRIAMAIIAPTKTALVAGANPSNDC
jgi:DNA-binding CsgD family transcriptional regulator